MAAFRPCSAIAFTSLAFSERKVMHWKSGCGIVKNNSIYCSYGQPIILIFTNAKEWKNTYYVYYGVYFDIYTNHEAVQLYNFPSTKLSSTY